MLQESCGGYKVLCCLVVVVICIYLGLFMYVSICYFGVFIILFKQDNLCMLLFVIFGVSNIILGDNFFDFLFKILVHLFYIHLFV